MKVSWNYILTGALIVICGQLVLSHYQRKSEIDQFITEYKAYGEQVKGTLAMARALNNEAIKLRSSSDAKNEVIIKLANENRVLASNASKITRERDSLKLAGQTITDTIALLQNKDRIILADSLIIVEKDNTIVNQKEQLSIRQTQINELTESGRLFQSRGDSLERVLNAKPKTPKSPNKLFNIIPLPDRKQSFLLGALTVTATWIFTK